MGAQAKEKRILAWQSMQYSKRLVNLRRRFRAFTTRYLRQLVPPDEVLGGELLPVDADSGPSDRKVEGASEFLPRLNASVYGLYHG